MHHKIAFEYSRATSIRFQTNLMRNMKYESCKRYAANICTCIQTCQYLSCRKVTNIEVLKCLCTKCIFFCAGTNVFQKGQRFSERNYHFLYIVYWTFLTTFLTMLTFHILKPSFSSFDMISHPPSSSIECGRSCSIQPSCSYQLILALKTRVLFLLLT